MGRLNSFVSGVITGLVAAAIGQELAKDPSARTWKGKVAGIPYNFRLVEWSDIAREYWDPESNHIITPHVIGMGWGINFAALSSWLQKVSQSNPSHSSKPSSEGRPTPLPPPITEPVDR